MENNKLIDKILENEKKGIWLEKLIEIWSIQLNGIDYAVHVDATKERVIEKVFSEKSGRLTSYDNQPTIDALDKIIKNIDHI